jgi:hypothetical protein
MRTRREILGTLPATLAAAAAPSTVTVPVDILFDKDAHLSDWGVRGFWSLWAEAVRDFGWCGVRFQTRVREAGMWRPPNRQPVISGLGAGVLNVVVTNSIPEMWDNGRILRGVTTLYRGHHLCMIAMNFAGRNRMPLVALNTCTHELLHALMGDIFELAPGGARGQSRELRIDWLATRLWLFHSGRGVRESARAYVERLRAKDGNQPQMNADQRR